MAGIGLSTLRTTPFWREQLPPPPVLADTPPKRVDVLVVGSGYTGLNAAIVTARAGRSTLVLDAEDPGFGCSTRNGGQVSTSVKPSLDTLAGKFGMEKARAIRGEGQNALDWLGRFIEGEGLACDFRRVGRFHAAHTPGHYEALTRDAEKMARDEGIESFAVPRSEQRSELGTDTYFGGVVYPRHCSVHPARLHREYLRLALDAGASVIGHAAVTGIERMATGFRVTSLKGVVEARDVIVATNGYTTGLTPWLRRRVIPIGSYIIVTDELPQETIDALFPTDRIASDTCKVIYYYRATPDRRRVAFGGRVLAGETDPAQSAPHLYRHMCRIFPSLEGCTVSHCWSGTVAYSFDELAHTGVHDGIHYAMNYCGSGVSMASYLGMRTGQKVVGLAEGRTAFDDLPHPTRPLYTGRPWFLPAAVAYYRWLDGRQWKKAAA
ncbi:MAG: FAD-dependent oxidoreductase [Rhodobacteraceae bacterium]|nr:FAD-dependent oxidoreductase [Paracoccaceae bacterium]